MADFITHLQTTKNSEGIILHHTLNYLLEKDGHSAEVEILIHASEMSSPSNLVELEEKANLKAKQYKETWAPHTNNIAETKLDLTGTVSL